MSPMKAIQTLREKSENGFLDKTNFVGPLIDKEESWETTK